MTITTDDRIIHNLLYNSKSSHARLRRQCIAVECIGENFRATRAWRRSGTARSTGRTGVLRLGVPLQCFFLTIAAKLRVFLKVFKSFF